MEFNEIAQTSLLYDFYGQLLTERQREVMELYHEENLTLSEIADEFSISRQGVHDLIKRCDRTLGGYEKKLQLIHKFQQTRELVAEIHKLTKHFKETGDEAFIDRIGEISSDIIKL